MVKKTFTLHLAKPDADRFEALLSEGATARLSGQGAQILDLEDFTDRGRLYVFKGQPREPNWCRELRQALNLPINLTTSSSCAILFFTVSDRIFAASFAHGWLYLEEDNFEGDFGLRAALNAVDEEKLKRLERANLGDALRGVSLSPFQRNFKSFGVDDALDLVRKISGEAKEAATADSFTEAKSLKISGDCSIEDLPELAQEALDFYLSNLYKQTSFQIVDFVSPITDPRLISILDQESIESIKSNNQDFELGVPEARDEESVAYKFVGPNLRRRYPDLLLRNYVEALGEKTNSLDLATLKSHKILAVYEDDAHPNRSWSIRKALLGSIVHEGGRYAMNEGEWYQIDESFKASIEQSFLDLVEQWPHPPTPLRKEYDTEGNGAYQSEASYNKEAAQHEGYVLLDQVMFNVPGIRGSAFELCDLLDLQNKRFIHVKKNSRRSSILSHFFKQGGNAAQQVKKFPSINDQLKSAVLRIAGTAPGRRIEALIAERERRWGVEFRIADVQRTNGQFNIPFFSKISLRDEMQNLREMDSMSLCGLLDLRRVRSEVRWGSLFHDTIYLHYSPAARSQTPSRSTASRTSSLTTPAPSCTSARRSVSSASST